MLFEALIFHLPTKKEVDKTPLLVNTINGGMRFVDYDVKSNEEYQGHHLYLVEKLYDLDDISGHYITEDMDIITAEKMLEDKVDEDKIVWKIIASTDPDLKYLSLVISL
jgi:hypothetical protein